MKKFTSLFLSTLLFTGVFFALPVANINTSFNSSSYSYAITKTNYFSGQTGTMNSLYNPYSGAVESKKYNIPSPTLPKDSKVSTVVANVTFSSKGSPFKLYVESPNGSIYSKLIQKSGEVNFTEFKDEKPNGTWKVSIITADTNPYKPSIGSARLKINYTYEQ